MAPDSQSVTPDDTDWYRLLDEELAKTPEGGVRLRFNFRYQPWQDVLDWFAEQAGLSLVFETLPTGTCNYVDNREYTPAEAIDILNSLLLIKGYTLVRRERMLIVVNMEDFEDGIPGDLTTMVPVDDLDERGNYELVSTVFQLEKITAEEAAKEIEELIGPQGKVVVLPKAQQLVVTEIASRLRTIRDALRRIEDPEGLASHELRSFPLDFALAEEVLAILRQLFGIDADQNAAEDGSIRFALDPLGMRLIAFGKPDKLDQVAKVLEAIDTPAMDGMESQGPQAALQLEVYDVAPADPESVLKVAQTLLAGSPGARLSIDTKTGNLIALCRPEEHATLQATLEQLRNDAVCVEVVPLRSLDPQVAVLSITKLFGGEGSSLKVDADPTTRRLVVRGPKALVEQIRAWLEKMGEGETAEAGVTASGNVRMVPLSGWAGKSALERLQVIWPTMRQNKIRVVTPSAVIPTMRTSRPAELPQPEGSDAALLQQLFGLQSLLGEPGAPFGQLDSHFGQPETQGSASGQLGPWGRPDSSLPEQMPEEPVEPLPPVEASPGEAKTSGTKSTGLTARNLAARARFVFASENAAAEPATEPAQPEPTPSEAPQQTPEAPPRSAQEPPPIVVAPGPGGIMIASEDIEALNELEELLQALGSTPMAGTADMTIFYLVHAKAAAAAETLDAVFGGGTLAESRSSSGGDNLLGDLAGAAFGEAGALMGSLLGLGEGGTIAPSGSVQIVPDTRLNALIVRADPNDTETIRQLLEILDQPESPEEVLANAQTELIPVYNTLADEVAEVVRQVFQANLQAGSGSGRPPSPQEFIEALRGGRGRGRSSRRSAEEVQKMSLGVDTRANALVVSAPQPLLNDVRHLVETLDQAAIGSSNETVQVVTLKQTNAETVQEALSSLVGENVTFGGTSSRSRGSSSSGRSSGSPPRSPFSGSGLEDMRRRIEFFRALRGGGGPPGFGGGGPPGFGGRRGGFGGSPRGGSDGGRR